MEEEKSKYWTRVDEFRSSNNTYYDTQGTIYTYEHVLPHGKLILTEHRWQSRLSSTVVFVPTPPDVPVEPVPKRSQHGSKS